MSISLSVDQSVLQSITTSVRQLCKSSFPPPAFTAVTLSEGAGPSRRALLNLNLGSRRQLLRTLIFILKPNGIVSMTG
jgi:hypothetical protein